MVRMGKGERSNKGGRGQLAYQPLEDDHDVEGDEKAPRRSPSGRHGGGSVSPTNGNSRSREMRRAGSGSPTAGMVELAPVKGRSKKKMYEVLEDGDGVDDADGAGMVGTETNGEVAGRSSGAVVCDTPAGDRPDSGGEEDRDRGELGLRGLLSKPNVKMILFIVAIVQVRLHMSLCGSECFGRR